MDDIKRLENICLAWPELIRKKEEKYKAIKDPRHRIMPAVTIINLKIELRAMEEELCKHIKLPLEYDIKPA
jgi:hypothetical protein